MTVQPFSKMHISDALIQVLKIQNSSMRTIWLHGGEDARDKGISLQFSRGGGGGVNMLKAVKVLSQRQPPWHPLQLGNIEECN